MATAVTSPRANPRSLISRITPLESKAPLTEATVTAPAKRNRSQEDPENGRTLKRRRSDEERQANQYACFTPWVKACGSSCSETTREDRLHIELVQFVDYISPSKQEREAHDILVSRIGELLKTRWPDAQVTTFGSCATGLGLTGGDIDLVVAFGTSPSLSDSDRKRRLAAMGDALRRSGMIKWVNRIFGARVPIITFVTTEDLGEVSIDISIRNEDDTGIRAIPLVKQFLASMPALQTLVLAVKAFLSLRDLNDASQGTLSSYAITLMCISFLQRNPARRPQKQLDDPFTEKSLGLLLMDFFRHYGHDFSYATHYVSVSDRGTFPKKLKNWEVRASNPAVLAVQCILNPENNITRGCGKIASIVEAFKEAYHILQNAPLHTDGVSLLYHIYEVPQEDDTKRRLLDESVDSGAFSRAAASCCGEVSRRPVSGGVPLAYRSNARSDYNRNERNLLMRLGPGPVQMTKEEQGASMTVSTSTHTIQQFPVPRWRDDCSQQLSVSSFPNTQFEFQPHPQHVQGMHPNSAVSQVQGTSAMMHQIYPSQYSIPNHGPGYNGNHRYNNLSRAIHNHLTPQQSRRTGPSYNVRH